MKVRFKDFGLAMAIKNNGIELEVRNTNRGFLGDLIVTKAQLIWCKGRTNRANGKKITWEDFITYMESLP